MEIHEKERFIKSKRIVKTLMFFLGVNILIFPYHGMALFASLFNDSGAGLDIAMQMAFMMTVPHMLCYGAAGFIMRKKEWFDGRVFTGCTVLVLLFFYMWYYRVFYLG